MTSLITLRRTVLLHLLGPFAILLNRLGNRLARQKKVSPQKDTRQKFNGFPLHFLPPSALRRVLIQFDLLDILEISLMSKKLRALIQECSIPVHSLGFRWYRIKMYRFGECDEHCEIGFYKEREEYFVSETRRKKFVEWKRETVNTINCSPVDENDGRVVLFNYLNELFVVQQLHYTVDCWPTSFIDNYMYKLPRRIYSLTIPGDGKIQNGAVHIDVYLETFHSIDCLKITNGEFRLSKNKRPIKTLVFEYAMVPISDVNQFECDSLEISNNIFRSTDYLNKLFWNWKNNKTRLSYLRISFERDQYNLIRILEGIELEPSRYADCFEIKRDCDGLMAVIGFGRRFLEIKHKQNCKIEDQKTITANKFPMFKLPLLALKEVFNEMNPAEILEISLLSKKSKSFLKACTPKANRIELNNNQILISDQSGDNKQFVLDFDNKRHESTSVRVIKNSGFVSWLTCNRPEDTIIYCTPINSADVLVAFEYFLGLYKFQTVSYRARDPTYTYNDGVWQVPKINLWNLALGTSSNDSKWFQSINDLEVEVPVRKLPETMSHIRSISLTQPQKLSFNDLLKLNHSSISVSNHELTEGLIKTWIKHWKENNTKIETLSLLKKQWHTYNLEYILSGLNKKPWETKNEKEREEYLQSSMGAVWEIQRNSDGAKASVGIRGGYLEMKVWKD
ncbi:hypothetical protein GCK72_008200 [Caenorhabditis remanei]|uniref:F-box domain-containing protein n=1 Tax=Caenorhabditis remanei TaxID=31234 RepID=A0A6A5GZE1_CAERE|nr:hypothetical protein GCK72_008200 [Caenorhabditis remanei]KAF1759955.1 hypothetical protein GCK72_008200 [Caenorhabditis remanei]